MKKLLFLWLFVAAFMPSEAQRVSDLTPASTLTGAELMSLVQSGVTRRTTTQDIANLAASGDFIAVGTIADRNAIPNGRRKIGTHAYVVADSTVYRLVGSINNTNWRPVPSGGSSGPVAWTDIVGLPSSFPPSPHTLSLLTQSGAFVGQVPQWDGSQWVPATVSGGGGGAPGAISFPTRSAIAALTPSVGQLVYLYEPNREGFFVYKSANYVATVATDSLQGVFIAPSAAPSGASGAWERVHGEDFLVTWFGAIRLDPSNPDAAPAADNAVQSTVGCGLAFSPSGSPNIILPGRFRLDRDPSQMINGVQHYTMLYVPYIGQSDGNAYRSITFRGTTMANMEGQHVINMPQSFNGSGFYCSRLETTNRGATVLCSEKAPSGADIFNQFNYTKIVIDNVSVIVNTKSGGTDVKNYMSGLDLNIFTQAYIPYASVTTSSLGVNSVKPDSLSFGIRLPALNNHAMVSGGNLNARGFGIGVVLGEHTALNHVLAVGNNIGILNRYAYPAWVSELDLEDNATQIYLEASSMLTVGNLQCEDFSPAAGFGSKWFNFKNHVDAPAGQEATAKLIVNGFMAHFAGGAVNTITQRSPLIDVDIRKTEQGLNLTALNFWTYGTRPGTPNRSGIYGWNTIAGGLDIWTGVAYEQMIAAGTRVFREKFGDPTRGFSPVGMRIGIGGENTTPFPLAITDGSISGIVIHRDNSSGNTDGNFGLFVTDGTPTLQVFNRNTANKIAEFRPAGDFWTFGNLITPGALQSNSVSTIGITAGFRSVTATYTAADADYTLACSGTLTVSLPSASGRAGKFYVVKNVSSGTVTIDPAGSETIDGAGTVALNTQWATLQLQSDGNNWLNLNP